MPQTLAEKIATAHAVGLEPGSEVFSGDFVNIRPKHVMTHDNTSAVMSKFEQIFAPSTPRVHDPRQPVFAIDHDIQNTSSANLGKYARIEKFANEQAVDFYPAGTGISHQVMVEYGYATPGAMIVGSDSHSNLYGAVSALGTPVVRTDAASIWATGQTWWQVPPVARVELQGRLRPGVVGKDVIIALCGLFNHDEVLNMAVEFVGEGVGPISMDQRMSIANMTTEWGALAGVFPFDEVLRDYLKGRAEFLHERSGRGVVDNASGATPRYTAVDVDRWFAQRLEPDADAHYAAELALDLDTVIPHVSGPDHVKVMHSLPEIQK
ncbi:MAG: aconitase family protein, partial [Planctomycetota bacterium]